MISRYTREKMGQIWTEQMKWQKMLEVELAVCSAWAQLGKIPQSSLSHIKKHAKFDIGRIKEIEKETKHDIIAFLTSIAENVGEDSRFIHMGLTSNDAIDTGQALQLREASDILLDGLSALLKALKKKAKKYKYVPMSGRSHNVHAEPITFGLKLAVWYEETKRNIARLREAKKGVCVGKLSGAVGTYSNIDPRVEKIVLKQLGLGVEAAANQVVQRDRHAHYMATLAIIAASLEKFTTEIRNLQHTEIREVEEYFSKGQKGSSAMPHKRNPITSERICGLARLLRGYALAAMENVALWHERDISHSSVERVILPDAAIVLDYMLALCTELIDKLLVYPETMLSNMEKTRGLMFSQRVLITLVEKGLTREEAYRIVQGNALKVWKGTADFKALLLCDDSLKTLLSKEEIERCFDLKFILRNVDMIFKRIGIL
ncbi:MAG: adenylosuccinate lyase [Candidatus Omnitrophica bacterium]|nr:adenylosuccinate lyase [Candidatus Omnitrophota bacterium]MBU4479017.1 adenylosuccinate lyase [Candidatus Omnitrophota bacterium]MCG2703812.1 adenylosuccinate lyase [Candidatus Omnitrophota bacterium]